MKIMKTMKKKYIKNEGFTLIELLTVVAIIAALMGVVVVEWMGTRMHYECWQRTIAGTTSQDGWLTR